MAATHDGTADARYSPGKVVIFGSQCAKSPSQKRLACGTWNTSSMYGSGTIAVRRTHTVAWIDADTAAAAAGARPSRIVHLSARSCRSHLHALAETLQRGGRVGGRGIGRGLRIKGSAMPLLHPCAAVSHVFFKVRHPSKPREPNAPRTPDADPPIWPQQSQIALRMGW